MILSNFKFNFIVEWDGNNVNTLVIENPKLFYSSVREMIDQSEGVAGDYVLSDNNSIRILDIPKTVEVISDIFHFPPENKKIITGIHKELSDIAINEHTDRVYNLFSETQDIINEIVHKSSLDLIYDDVHDISNILKIYNVRPDYMNMSLGEKMLLYMELCNKYLRKNLFVIVNIRACFNNEDLEILFKDFIYRKYNILIIENHDCQTLKNEIKRIIDNDLCEI